jgi:N,N'-diacetylchitobiose phosphorylase
MKLVAPERQQTEVSPSDSASRISQPRAIVLSNGPYTVRLTEVGSGYSTLREKSITRWNADDTRDADGFYVFVRDLESKKVWSAGYQPTRALPSHYEFRPDERAVGISRLDFGIECESTIFIAAQHDFEVRLCRLTNHDDCVRQLEITSYLEWVLGSHEFDSHHPAFSKLFIETRFCREHGAIIARRRPRHNDDSEFWGFHSIIANDPRTALEHENTIQFETNRARFIGRGRTLAAPMALCTDALLSGDCGPVLDPIASLRVVVTIQPGESRDVAYLLGAGSTHDEIEKSLLTASDPTDVNNLRETSGIQSVNGQPLSSTLPEFIRASTNRKHRSPFPFQYTVPRRDIRPASGERALQLENGYGGFSADGREYVIRLRPDGYGGHCRPPMPWTNVVANEQGGFLVSESGAGYTWSGNSRLNRLTAWHNDPICDPPAEALWIRDEEAKTFWSPMPGPTPAEQEYEARHGFGYTIFEHTSHELSQEVTMFMARKEPLKLTRLRLMNLSERSRRLTLYSYVHWSLGGLASETSVDVNTSCSAHDRTIWATNPHREPYSNYAAFSSLAINISVACQTSFTCDRTAFLGQYGDHERPAAIVAGNKLDGRTGNGFDPCAAWQATFELPPGGSFECTLLLGDAAEIALARRWIEKYGEPRSVQNTLEEVQQFWRDTLSAVTIETPDPEINLLVNGWLAYQNLSCRMWARSAYYQPGGAYGFRDQLQDSAALIYHRPDITRAQILRHAAQQFVEGDVLHWWHPDTGYGLRTRFSDDLLWLPCIAGEYVQRTGDDAILDENVPFVAAPPLAAGQQEAYLRPEKSGESASVYEHCCRALDRGLTSGSHGLPLIGCGDWNDGFSRVGRLGNGESVWLGFFIDYVLQQILPICANRDDQARVERYSDYRQRLGQALNSSGWDGIWYRRAYYDNGQPIGSATSDECQIDALAQAWAVISGAAPTDRAQSAMQAVEDRLVDDNAGMIRLLAPPFDHTPNDPGYIKGYLPGIRENGGQYTHGVLWVVRALAEMGRGTRAVELLKMLTPVWHTSTPDRVDVYKTEPYAVAADIYGQPPHVGRGGWTWYTGSAGWMFRVAIESIFGISLEGGTVLCVKPSISSNWPQCRLAYRLPNADTRYEIVIENPRGKEHGVSEAFVDGQPIFVEKSTARIRLVNDNALHRVLVRL